MSVDENGDCPETRENRPESPAGVSKSSSVHRNSSRVAGWSVLAGRERICIAPSVVFTQTGTQKRSIEEVCTAYATQEKAKTALKDQTKPLNVRTATRRCSD